MDERFTIYVDRLKGGEQLIDETIPSEEMDLGDEAPKDGVVKVQGRAYLADGELVIQFHVVATVQHPCVICNKVSSFDITLDNHYITPEIEECKSGLYYFFDTLREEIILEIPHYHECCDGHCPERERIEKYLKKADDGPKEETQQPFAELL